MKRIVELSPVSQEFDEPLAFDLRDSMKDGQVRMIQFYHLDGEHRGMQTGEGLNIMMVRDGNGEVAQGQRGPCWTIVDSAADVTVLPASFSFSWS